MTADGGIGPARETFTGTPAEREILADIGNVQQLLKQLTAGPDAIDMDKVGEAELQLADLRIQLAALGDAMVSVPDGAAATTRGSTGG